MEGWGCCSKQTEGVEDDQVAGGGEGEGGDSKVSEAPEDARALTDVFII